MRLEHVRLEKPQGGRRVRLVGTVHYDSGGDQEQLWFEVPEECQQYLSSTGNPWLVALLPVAATLGEPLRLNLPVDPVLLRNVQEVLRIWKLWHPRLHVVSIEADVADGGPSVGKTAAFFSGGVDSFFAVLSHHPQFAPDTAGRINDLISVWGFDIPLRNREAFGKMRDRAQRDAADLGLGLIDVATNMLETQFRTAQWGPLSHGCALASVGLLMEKAYANVLIASTHSCRDLQPWGSHPLTDPLLSTSSTRICHDGAGFTRVEKTAHICKSEVAMRSLRVCYKLGSEENCGVCEKCYRTMLTLYLLGALDRCATFDKSKFQLEKVPKILCADWNSRAFMLEIKELALERGDVRVARLIARCLRRSSRLCLWPSLRKRLVWRLDNTRFLSSFAGPLRSAARLWRSLSR